MKLVFVKATSGSSVPCTTAFSSLEMETITITQTSTTTVVMSQAISSVPCTQPGSTGRVTQTITVSHISTTTVIVSQTPGNVVLNQVSESTGSQTAWMAVAILFIIFGILGLILSLVLGCLLYKKYKRLDKPNTSSSTHYCKTPLAEGELKS